MTNGLVLKRRSGKYREWKICCCVFTLSLEPWIWKFYVVIRQSMSRKSPKVRVAHAERLFSLTQPIRSLSSLPLPCPTLSKRRLQNHDKMYHINLWTEYFSEGSFPWNSIDHRITRLDAPSLCHRAFMGMHHKGWCHIKTFDHFNECS